MFQPEEIIFAPTSRCNLKCVHCRVSRSFTGTLDTKAAVDFLSDAAECGIERVGFSGGEPFLEPDFLMDLCKAAVDLDLLFDRLMTNGLWWKTGKELEQNLTSLAEARFDGRIGLSADLWHGSTPERLVPFIEAVFEIFGRKDCVDITGVLPKDASLSGQHSLILGIAHGLGGKVLFDKKKQPYLITDGSNSSLDGERLEIPVQNIPYSSAADENAWQSKVWFEDDFCEGPGQVLYVHPNGDVAVCCGFANERPELRIGNIYQDSTRQMIDRANEMPLVKWAYQEGLGELRKRLESEGKTFPGKTADMCFFCDYVCEKKWPE